MISREQALESVAGQHFEVVVIGGGITGAAVALDAASRGYSTALLEGRDYGFGTSSKSSKMVHGGLRYLENFDLGLVREALVERQLMVRRAPHLVYPTPYLVPSFDGDRPDRKVSLGLNAYDVLASGRRGGGPPLPGERRRLGRPAEAEGGWSPDRHRTVDGEEAVAMAPALAERSPDSAFLFYDCQTDDVRLLLTALEEAERYGAVCLNGAQVNEVSASGLRVDQVAFTDSESGERVVVGANNVVNATGVWADLIRPGEIESDEGVPQIRPSRGTHLLLSTESLDMGQAACVLPAGDGRSIFALPWYDRTLVGTTDLDYEGPLDSVEAPESDLECLLDAVNDLFDASLTDSDVVGAYAGVRPLISTGDPKKSVDISRRAELYETSSGMLTITGGKLTTWRRMGQQVIDRVVERAGRNAPCLTAEIPLGMELAPAELDRPDGVSEESVSQLAFRYGHQARSILDLARDDPALAAPVVPGRPDLMAEVAWAVDAQQARSLEDVFLRRTRLGLTAASDLAAPGAASHVADLMGRKLGWGRRRRKAEQEAWLETVRRDGLAPGVSGMGTPLATQ
ncbi:MAG: FAD-dependent oxidoreductase [Solirubrobacterales bacterium]